MIRLKRFEYSEITERVTLDVDEGVLKELNELVNDSYEPVFATDTIPTITEDMVAAAMRGEELDNDVKVRWKHDADDEGFSLRAAIQDTVEDMFNLEADYETIDSDRYDTTDIEVEEPNEN